MLDFYSEQLRKQAYCIGHVQDFKINKPYKIKFYGEKFVLWRSKQNKIAILTDVCPHAGASLSDGFICEKRNTVVCPYHRLEFDSNGQWFESGEYKTHEELNKSYAKVCDTKEVKLATLLNHSLIVQDKFIWIYPKTHDLVEVLTPEIPKVFDILSDGISFHLTDHFTFQSTVNPLHFMENLADIQHFAGSHFKTVFTDKVVLEKCVADGNIIDFDFSLHMKQLTMLDFFKNPILFLFPKVIYNQAKLSIPNCFAIKAKIADNSEVLTYITWYPQTEDRFMVNVHFYESVTLNPILNFLLRPSISKSRKTIINEDRAILQTIPRDFVNRRIHLKNDEVIFELRKILKEQFEVNI
jgi:phenylpropionate dioxygenase-like ring-hydroxylating dioxygenase large terminal subunit